MFSTEMSKLWEGTKLNSLALKLSLIETKMVTLKLKLKLKLKQNSMLCLSSKNCYCSLEVTSVCMISEYMYNSVIKYRNPIA